MEEDAPSIRGAVNVACGGSHSCAVMADGSARCWGNNSYGALGNGSEKGGENPVVVSGLKSIADVSVDFGRTCARTSDGKIFCWGDSEFGKAGDGRMPDNTGREKTTPGASILSGAATLTVAMAHACSAMTDGTLWCWGQNNSGACGLPLKTRYVPRPKPVPKLTDIVMVSAGESSTCDLDRQGKVYCWGGSSYGFLGPAGPKDEAPHETPVLIPLPASATEITVGDTGHACARMGTGEVYCWGHNANGELGDGTTTDRVVPVRVVGLTKVTHVSAGLEDTCALVEGGRVFCWGKDMMRRDDNGGVDDALVPSRVVVAKP